MHPSHGINTLHKPEYVRRKHTLIFYIAMIPGAVGIMVAQIDVKINCSLQNHQDRNPVSDNFIPVFVRSAFVGQDQIRAALTIVSQGKFGHRTAIIPQNLLVGWVGC